MLKPNAYTEFTKESVGDNCSFKHYRTYSAKADMDSNDIKAAQATGIFRKKIYDIAAHCARAT
jgi:hypothetical protein